MQLALEGIENQAQAFQSRGAQEWLIAVFAKDNRGCAAVAAILEIGVTDFAANHRAIRQREVELLVRLDSQGAQSFSGHQTVHGPRVDQKINRQSLATVSRWLD